MVRHGYGSGASYALGAALTTRTCDSRLNGGSYEAQHATFTTNSHAWRDGAVLTNVSLVKTPQGGSPEAAITTAYTLRHDGQVASAAIDDERDRTITFQYDVHGQIVKRQENDGSSANPHEIWYRFDGKQLGHVGNNGTADMGYAASIADRTQAQGTGAFRHGGTGAIPHARFGPNLEQISSYSQGEAGGAYAVRAGDTLAGLAAALWGDASLWYKLAEANGLSGDAGLVEGQRLNIPAGVVRENRDSIYFPRENPAPPSPLSPRPSRRQRRPRRLRSMMAG